MWQKLSVWTIYPSISALQFRLNNPHFQDWSHQKQWLQFPDKLVAGWKESSTYFEFGREDRNTAGLDDIENSIKTKTHTLCFSEFEAVNDAEENELQMKHKKNNWRSQKLLARALAAFFSFSDTIQSGTKAISVKNYDICYICCSQWSSDNSSENLWHLWIFILCKHVKIMITFGGSNFWSILYMIREEKKHKVSFF